MQFKFISFGEDEAKMLEFIDNHFSRVINAGYNAAPSTETSDAGYYVRYSKAAVPSESVKLNTSNKRS